MGELTVSDVRNQMPADEREVLGADARFFEALLAADAVVLDGLLDDRFVLVDVMAGSVIPKAELVSHVGARTVVFETIERTVERAEDQPVVRLFGPTALVTGRTRMTGRVGEVEFTAASRYTHVFVADPAPHEARWRLVNAQGTKLD
ncbi:nuclear transport factor 2 family protein [Kitasatospora sp. NPDC008050]|uniref:nuclear transport factor 2 family protein n=1 Tax=Kitasatospora sp. NPDC008050 TaxID=3364021 RepID=UPI0036F192A9